MKIRVGRDEILEVLQKVQSIITPKTTLPILSNVLLKAEDGKLTLVGTDLEVSVKTSVNAEVEIEGSTTLPAKRLYSVFRELPLHEIDIEVDQKNVSSISCGVSFFKLVGLGEDNFPTPPEFEGGQSYSIEQAVFKDMLRKTGYAASTDDTRYLLNGVLLSFKGEMLTVVATDGRRLALVEQELEFSQDAEADYILPSKTVHELIRNLGDEGMLDIQVSENQISFAFDTILVISKLIEGVYPNFRQVIPSELEHRIPIEREALLTATRRMALIADDPASSIRLVFGKNRIELISEAPEVGEAREQIPAKYDDKEITIAFNPGYLMEPLKVLNSDEVYLEVTDDLSPGALKSNIPFLYVLMPMRSS